MNSMKRQNGLLRYFAASTGKSAGRTGGKSSAPAGQDASPRELESRRLSSILPTLPSKRSVEEAFDVDSEGGESPAKVRRREEPHQAKAKRARVLQEKLDGGGADAEELKCVPPLRIGQRRSWQNNFFDTAAER